MADKRKLIELDIDIDSILSKSVTLKKELDTLREAQKELTKSGDTNSETFIRNAAAISKLSSDYSMNQKQLANLSQGTTDFLNINQKIALSIDKEVKSINDARENNAELLKIRNSLNLSKESEKKLADEINAKMDANNSFIKENVSSLEKQKIGIGDYASGMKQAIEETGMFNGQLSQVSQVFNTFSPIFNTLNQDIKNTINQMNIFGTATEEAASATENNSQAATLLSSGQRSLAASTQSTTAAQTGLTVATNIGTGAMRIFALAIAATGVGLIVIAIALLIAGLSKLDPVMDKIEQVTAGVGGAFSKAASIVTTFVSGITSVGDAFSKIGTLIANPLEAIKSFTSEVSKAAEAAASLKEAEQELGDVKIIYETRGKAIESQINLDKIRLKNKGVTAAEEIQIEKRINDNFEKLGVMRQEINEKTAKGALATAISTQIGTKKINQATLENEIKNGELVYANFLLNAGRIDQVAFDKLREAANFKQDSNNKAAEEEERTQNALDKASDKIQARVDKARAASEKAQSDAVAKKKENQDKEITFLTESLDLFIATESKKNKTSSEQIDFIFQQSQKRIAILDKEFEFGKITKQKYDAEILKIGEDTGNAQTQRLIDKSKSEIDLFIAENVSKIDADKRLTQAIIDEEDLRLQSIQQRRLGILEKEKETNQALIDEKRTNNEELTNLDLEFLTEKLNLENELKAANRENERALEEQLKAEKAEQLQIENEIAIGNSQSQLDANLLTLQFQYDEELRLLREKLDKEQITQKQFDDRRRIADNALRSNKNLAQANELKNQTDLYAGLGEAAQAFFGKSKALQTGIALAQTYANASAAYYSQFVPPTIDSPIRGAVAAGTAVLSGLANVASINKIQFAGGGELVGDSHNNGGIPFTIDGKGGFEAEGGEGIINKKSMAMFKPLLSALNVAGGGVSFANGGAFNPIMFNANTMTQTQNIDYELLANLIGQKVSNANASLPAPIVYTAVTDINSGQKNYAEIVEGADF